ncbi:ABC transporter permease [Metallumcola ferriviriculae]|uniref:ABC transporter permease n=1 Tax=Metallumcola ferriviriculae TaxID=3039180 RepID=A0AAU0UTE5_9FIRM|nr:ABC transporter permease [Desulfitibacteraceae bacterium MK1]
MYNLIKNEVIKIFAGKRMLVFMIITLVFSLLPKLEAVLGEIPLEITGQNMPLYMLNSMTNLILPIFLIITVADMITGEYAGGTLKLSLLHPVSRTKLLTAKLISLVIPMVFLLAFAQMTGHLLGTIFFGWGEQLTFHDVSLSTGKGLLVTAGAHLVSIIPLLTFSAVILLLALQFTNTGAAVGISIGLLMTLSVLGQLAVNLRPYLLISYFEAVPKLFVTASGHREFLTAAVVMAIYGGTSYLISIYQFSKKDILF